MRKKFKYSYLIEQPIKIITKWQKSMFCDSISGQFRQSTPAIVHTDAKDAANHTLQLDSEYIYRLFKVETG